MKVVLAQAILAEGFDLVKVCLLPSCATSVLLLTLTKMAIKLDLGFVAISPAGQVTKGRVIAYGLSYSPYFRVEWFP